MIRNVTSPVVIRVLVLSFSSAAVEALKKWDSGRCQGEESGSGVDRGGEGAIAIPNKK